MHMDMLIDLHTSRPYFEVFQFRIQVIQKIEQGVYHNITCIISCYLSICQIIFQLLKL